MTTLEVIDQTADELERMTVGIGQLLAELRSETSVDVLLNYHERARVVEIVAKAAKNAEEVRVGAARVRMYALLRLAQLGHMMPGHRPVQEWLLTLTADELLLIEQQLVESSLITIKRQYLLDQDVSKATSEYLAGEMGDDHPLRPEQPEPGWPWRPSMPDVFKAARVLLNAAITNGDPVTVSDMAEALADAVGYTDDYVATQVAEQVIREAIRLDGVDDDAFVHIRGVKAWLPKMVTYKPADTVESFVRLPWRIATSEQLTWHANFKMQQARDLMSAAEHLAAVAAEVADRAGPGNLTKPLGQII